MTFARLWVGDITKGDLGPVRADAIYTDPPWNPGIARIMRKWANADEGPVDFSKMVRLTAMAFARACPSGPWYVETGPNPEVWYNSLSKFSRSRVHIIPATWGPLMKSKPTFILCANGAEPIPSGLHGEEITARVMDKLAYVDSILDPFIGKGLTLRYAIPKGVSVFGMEINPKRLAESAKWMNKNHSEINLEYMEH